MKETVTVDPLSFYFLVLLHFPPPKNSIYLSPTMSEPSTSANVIDPSVLRGLQESTESDAMVLDFVNGQPVKRRVAWTSTMGNPTPATPNSDWMFEKIFAEGHFLAAGQLVIPARRTKSEKSTRDNAYVFYVIEGTVCVKIHETPMVIATGGMFMVPRGNTYSVENISHNEARLFFTQGRKVSSESEAAVGHPDIRKGSRRMDYGRGGGERLHHTSNVGSESRDGGEERRSRWGLTPREKYI
ncbi:Mif2/CENP-C like-domain-containing protein [Coprinopsis sp. MPI-PUGE-AT-0042]|nr:Mif2/CENP-C like-domain-containing protein [Coprinopsis sp. MPI-PUGE-AT-0042]